MGTRWRLWMLGLLAVVAAIFGVDWMRSTAQLDDILIETWVDPPSVVADGLSSTSITVRVTERGQPREHDLLQIWLGTGAGRLVPNWVFTDEKGMAVIEFTPNRYNPYDPQDELEIHIRDTSIGRLIEVGKQAMLYVPLGKPEE